ncbi:MAG: CRISPR system precrRNA processing endoribonuclease RAMP protein Cas6 [Roseiflexaceae bacterium]|nr:CRISPR system precrRNA processing endoribonuclease RAMP protein Cas6 [Roseiflexaceae bacterium]
MPTAIVLTLRPLHQATLMPDLGRAAHAAVLGWIRATDPDLAMRLHDDSAVRPLTVTFLPERHGQPPLVADPRIRYGLRVTALTSEVEAHIQSWTPEFLGTLAIGGAAWQIESIHDTAHTWAGHTTYAALVEEGIRIAATGVRRWTLDFTTPVTFRQRGRSQPLPLPDLVFGSLLERWNACAPLPIPEDVRLFIAESLAVSRFAIESAAGRGKGNVLQIGTIGRCSYTALAHEPMQIATIETLVRFGFYSGIGAGTTRGFGLLRLTDERSVVR